MARLLVVDDDPTLRKMFVHTLGALGEVSEASGGAEALKLLGAHRFDLVTLDLHMPVIDGFTVLAVLERKPGPSSDATVFVVTSDKSDVARARALLRKGATFFITKPVDLIGLRNLAQTTLEKAARKGPPSSRRG